MCTDVKPDNIMINRCSDGDLRFKEVCLADLGNTISIDNEHALNGYPLGTPIFHSPETTLGLPFNTAADIWSLGCTVRLIALSQYYFYVSSPPICL